ncbi:MAG: uroporphyrinogen decarboxylase family protein, partial [Anaerolineae bacterium]|nr:uroporphyrinogen decarboxylase family protein [Thermoflexales bacterium]MDW8407943.1 uroporphyrinogen decarboxylase family protein [Anaerolineae bacterium]
MNSRERILAKLEGRPVDRLPNMAITMMLAADQIGKPYLEYATDYRVLVEGQLRTAERFGIDHVSAISDPAVEAADCGADVTFYPNQPPAINEANALLADKSTLSRLIAGRANGTLGLPGRRMTNRLNGIRLLKERAGQERLIEGWIEGPCAESADLRGINNLMLDFADDPDFVTELFEFITAMELDFAAEQIKAGADIIGIGDAAASLVGPRVYNTFVWEYEKRLVDGIHALGAKVRLHICGNTRRILSGMGRLGADLIDLDYFSPVGEARAQMSPTQVLSGNIDPVRVLRDGTPDSVRAAIAECHRQAGEAYILAAGCEVPRDTPPDNLL